MRIVVRNSTSLATWLLTQKDRRQNNKNHHSKTQQIIYRVVSSPDWHVQAAVVRLFPDNSIGKPRVLNWGRLLNGNLPECADDVDQRWIAQLAPTEGRWHDGTIDILIEDMLVYHRLYWASPEAPLKRGRPRTIAPHWTQHQDGRQTLTWVADDERFIWLPHSRFGVCLDSMSLHELDVDGEPERMPRTLSIWPTDAMIWHQQFSNWGLPGPVALPVASQPDCPPIGHLICRSQPRDSGLRQHWADIGFQYGSARCYADSTHPYVYARQTSRWCQYRRQQDSEHQWLETACRVSWRTRTLIKGPRHTLPTEDDWLNFVLFDIPLLEQQGWHVEFDDQFDFHIVRAERLEGWLDHKDDGSDWFELNWQVEVNGESLELLPILLGQLDDVHRALADTSGGRALIKLPDGRRLLLEPQWLDAMVTLLKELFSHRQPKDNRVRLSRAELPYLLPLENTATLRWQHAENWRTLLKQLLGHLPLPNIDPGPSFEGQLRDYQLDGMRWLHRLAEAGLGGILADDMGLGKTIQTIAMLTRLKTDNQLSHPVLILAPTSVLYNWQRELERFAPDFTVTVVHGADRESLWQKHTDIIITSYPLVLRDWRHIQSRTFSVLVLDEAQMLKNPRAKTTQKVFTISASRRFALTGTPIENHLGELWSLMHLVNPGFLGAHATFNKLFRLPIERQQDTARQAQLAARVAPFIKRRTKQQVEQQLPPKTEIVKTVALYEEQQLLYDTIRLSMHARVQATIQQQGLARSHLTVLDALLKLRQICCHPQLVNRAGLPLPKRSAKTDVLMSMLVEMVNEGRRIIVFSQFTQMLDIISGLLHQHDMPHFMLTGQTRARQAMVDAFQSGERPIFLISLKAGGTGLNLTAADTVIHYDPWWNPAVENQATDRAHRIGQDKSVFVYRLICHGTVEEKIQALQKKKSELYESVLHQQDRQSMLKLTEEDINWLFGPLT